MTVEWIAVVGALSLVCAASVSLLHLARRRQRETGDPELKRIRDEWTMVMLKAYARSPDKGF